MAPEVKEDASSDASETQEKSTDGVDTSKAEAALKAKLSRKRTKTGCLTCRKRRIKCGEEHPVCKNCIKSKRHCEGYSQRVVFRPPTFDYRPAPNGGAHITFQAGPVAAPTIPFHTASQHVFDTNPYSDLRPRPAEQVTQAPPAAGQQYAYVSPIPSHIPDHMVHIQHASVQQPVSSAFVVPAQQVVYAQAPYQSQPLYSAPDYAQPMASMTQAAHQQQYQPSGNYAYDLTSFVGTSQPPDTYGYSSAWPDPDAASAASASQNATPPAPYGSTYGFEPIPVSNDHPTLWTIPTYTPRPELSRPLDCPPDVASNRTKNLPHSLSDNSPSAQGAVPEFYQYQAQLPTHYSPTQMLCEAAVELQDDDYYDVQSDEEMEIDTLTTVSRARKKTLHKVLMNDRLDMRDMQIRRYDTFLFDGMLDHYRVEWNANPLKNPATARVFAHFISATGPSLSIFERHPASSSTLFTEGSVPPSQQGLWTYTMPMAALHHQGLLHAMLALSSLHIARLQRGSITPSVQHYAWALKRVHSCVASKNPKKRLQVTTIAASMLLGFYEVITADHSKWNTHLAGAKQLFLETDFVGMTRQLRKLKREKAMKEQRNGRRNSISAHFQSQHDLLLDKSDDVDENTVSYFVGREIRYDNHGYVESPQTNIPQELDVGKFETLKDLYWWYCKQDAFQSIVSGNGLLLDYSRWAQCPPRAPLGRPDAVYGSYDHLILLLGRIADFAAKDRTRKLKQMEVNGGQWRPAPGMKVPGPPQAPPSAAPTGAPPAQDAGPTFFGMAPPPKPNVQMPTSYNPAYDIPTPQSAQTPDTFDLQMATQAALEEYGRIRAALQEFARALSGEAFQPLAAEYQTPLNTPFGPALFYRSYDIGCLWAIYNMCMIIVIRSHPHMHPAAHAAAAIAAKETAFFANEVGRIAAGIVPGPANKPLNPTLGSALCDSCLPSFFAAIQYQRPDERHETVMRIYGIALRTGWGSAELIANGCETAWVRAGQAGRGPPYQRCVRPQHSDDPRLNGHWERLESGNMPEEMEENDRRLIKVDPNARLQWAVGVMGMESDYGKAA